MPTAPYQRYLTMPAEVKAAGDGSVRRVIGTGTTSSLDRHGEHVHPDAVAKSNDTLDVWIDSGSSSRSVIARSPTPARMRLQRS